MKKPRIYIVVCLIVLTLGCVNPDSISTSNQNHTNEGNVQLNEGKVISRVSKEEIVKELGTEAIQVQNKHGLKPLYDLNELNWSIDPISNETEQKVVLLTIDDAPDIYALEMAKTLKEHNAKAIFFVNGHFIQTEEKKQMLREIHNLGFPIGNHTISHRNLKDLSEEEQYQEIVELNNQIEKIVGEKPKFFRAPFGSNTEYSRKLAKEEGMLLMNWTYGYDWEQGYMEEKALTNIMVNSPLLTNGANLLLHDRKWTNAALSKIVSGLKNKGYKIVDPDRIKISNGEF